MEGSSSSNIHITDIDVLFTETVLKAILIIDMTSSLIDCSYRLKMEIYRRYPSFVSFRHSNLVDQTRCLEVDCDTELIH